MNNLIVILIAVALLGTTVALAGKHRSGGGHRTGGTMEAVARHFDLSDEQLSSIRESFAESREQGRVLREKMGELRENITDSIRTNGYDEEQVRLIVENNIPLLVDAMMLRIGTMAEIYEQLTPEQQAEADKFLENGGPRRWRHHRHGPDWDNF